MRYKFDSTLFSAVKKMRERGERVAEISRRLNIPYARAHRYSEIYEVYETLENYREYQQRVKTDKKNRKKTRTSRISERVSITILRYLNEQDMSQSELARQAGVTRAEIYSLINQNHLPSPETAGVLISIINPRTRVLEEIATGALNGRS